MKMLLEAFLLIAVIIIIIYAFFYFAPSVLSPVFKPGAMGSVCIKERCFSVQVANTPAQRERGLMDVSRLDKDGGMLFVFDKEGFYPFWMKNTLIPLDIIWIREDPATGSGQVVFISQNAQPCKTLLCPQIAPSEKAKYVLEINGGVSADLGLKESDYVKIEAGND